MADEISPEEKLLRLIKEGKSPSKPAPERSPEPHAPERAASKASSASEPKKKGPGLPPSLRSWTEKFHTDLELLPRIFLGLSLALGALIVYNLISDRVQSRKKLDRLWSAGSQAARSEKKFSLFSSAKPTGATLPEKDLFKFLEEPPPSAPKAAAPARVASLNSILANYTLSGIISDEPPQAVIEDKKQGKTFFLNVGDTLGDIKIVAIEDGKVIVAVGNEQAELNL